MTVDSVSADVRRAVLRKFAAYVIGDGPGFGKRVGDRIQVTELAVSVRCSEATAVCEIVVEEDMLDVARRVLHAGCSAYLIDMCTALPYVTLGLAQEELEGLTMSKFAMAPFAPSQRLDISYYHPACLGTRLRIIGKSVMHHGSSLSVRSEIWDMGKGRMVASAMHTKVMPQKPPLAAAKQKL